MATTTLGKVSVTPKGAWSASSAYDFLDIVSHVGNSYIAKQSVPAGTALTNTDYWLVIANKGDKGDTGDTGETGAQGVSVESAEVNASGHLIVTLDDGTTIDAGFVKGDSGNPEGNILQTLGQSEEDTVSQKCVTDALDEKADINGYYDELTAGNAEQLIATVGNEDNAPYLYRTSGGSADIGNRVSENYIEGGTVVRNQAVRLVPGTKTTSGVTLTAYSDYFVLNGTAQNDVWLDSLSSGLATVPENYCAGHTVLISFATDIAPRGRQIGTSQQGYYSATWQTIVSSFNVVPNSPLQMQIYSGETFDNTKFIPNIIDLTQMFGSAIADHLASLPIADALVKLKPWIDTNKYYAYNTGSFESVNLAKKVVTGFNQWDEEWEVGFIDFYTGLNDTSTERIRSKNYIPVLPSTNYYLAISDYSIGSNGCHVHWYDAEKNHISGVDTYNSFLTTPSNARYMRFTPSGAYGKVYKNNICINRSGSRNGEYKAYESHEYAMPSGELRGIPKLDANNRIVYDGDRYYPDGGKDIRYGIVDLGTLDWAVYASGKFYTLNPVTGIKPGATGDFNHVFSTMYRAANVGSLDMLGNLETSVDTSGYIQLRNDAYTDAAAFKTAMSGVYLIYELATPTTSEGTPYQQTQIVDDWGTEEFVPVTGNEMPVGHNSFYGANLRDKLQHLPNLANADGTYAVQQVGSQMTLVPIAQVIPTPPASGTYTLKCTNGTMTWVEEA